MLRSPRIRSVRARNPRSEASRSPPEGPEHTRRSAPREGFRSESQSGAASDRASPDPPFVPAGVKTILPPYSSRLDAKLDLRAVSSAEVDPLRGFREIRRQRFRDIHEFLRIAVDQREP